MLKKSYHVNVYLSKQDYKALNEIKNKYHLSYSTITYIIVKNLSPWEKEIDLKEEWMYKTPETTRSHIKLRAGYNEPARKIDNLLKMFLRKDLKNRCKNEELFKMINDAIYKDFQNTYDENWDGNHFNRSMVKWLKHNRDYAKKVLENE